MNIACVALNQFSNKYMLKQYTKTGIKTIQLKTFNEIAYYEKLNKILIENPGMTADKLATYLKINLSLVKEHILQAEL